MSGTERGAVLAAGVLAMACLALLAVRGRLRRCWSFSLYLASVALNDFAVAAWPARLFDWWFWLAAEIVQGALVLAVACEITARALCALPRAAAVARVLLLLSLAGAVALMWSGVPVPGGQAQDVAQHMVSRLTLSRAVGFTGLMAVVLYYGIPLDELHLAIVRGLAAYSLLLAGCVEALRLLGWDSRGWLGALSTSSYLILLLYWCYAAWRRDSPAPPAVTRMLWPWQA